METLKILPSKLLETSKIFSLPIYRGALLVFFMRTHSSIRLSVPIMIGPFCARICALGCTTVRSPIATSPCISAYYGLQEKFKYHKKILTRSGFGIGILSWELEIFKIWGFTSLDSRVWDERFFRFEEFHPISKIVIPDSEFLSRKLWVFLYDLKLLVFNLFHY